MNRLVGTENENDVTNDFGDTEIASNGGADITVHGISQNEKTEMKKKRKF